MECKYWYVKVIIMIIPYKLNGQLFKEEALAFFEQEIVIYIFFKLSINIICIHSTSPIYS